MATDTTDAATAKPPVIFGGPLLWSGTEKSFTEEQTEKAWKAIERPDHVSNNRSLNWVTEKVCGVVENPQPFWWLPLFIFSSCLAGIGVGMIFYLLATGVGVWGLNHPVGWAWDITNFVFWIGIGHAGTLISAILFLTRQNWRTAVNRAAEAMTIFAVICAGIFPGIHVGRIWMVWFMAPVPNANAIWPNFRSPLLWDVFAVSTYFTVSLLFWYMGLIPDLASLRDRAKNKFAKWAYGFFSLGWVGSCRHWNHYEMAYLILAGISTPLVLSVHSVVSFDFATSVIPGWHTTIFPPYFVAGAIFGGFAMVLTLLIPVRHLFGMQDIITTRHIDVMCKIVLLTGTIVGYAYLMELFIAWYGANPNERYAFYNRILGPYASAYWAMMFCNVILPQLFWFRSLRRNDLAVWLIVFIGPNVGMWFERFVIIVTSIHRDFLPSSWGLFYATTVDIWTFIGSIGIFMCLFLLFIRFLPMIAVAEIKSIMPQGDPHGGHDEQKDAKASSAPYNTEVKHA